MSKENLQRPSNRLSSLIQKFERKSVSIENVVAEEELTAKCLIKKLTANSDAVNKKNKSLSNHYGGLNQIKKNNNSDNSNRNKNNNENIKENNSVNKEEEAKVEKEVSKTVELSSLKINLFSLPSCSITFPSSACDSQNACYNNSNTNNESCNEEVYVCISNNDKNNNHAIMNNNINYNGNINDDSADEFKNRSKEFAKQDEMLSTKSCKQELVLICENKFLNSVKKNEKEEKVIEEEREREFESEELENKKGEEKEQRNEASKEERKEVETKVEQKEKAKEQIIEKGSIEEQTTVEKKEELIEETKKDEQTEAERKEEQKEKLNKDEEKEEQIEMLSGKKNRIYSAKLQQTLASFEKIDIASRYGKKLAAKKKGELLKESSSFESQSLQRDVSTHTHTECEEVHEYVTGAAKEEKLGKRDKIEKIKEVMHVEEIEKGRKETKEKEEKKKEKGTAKSVVLSCSRFASKKIAALQAKIGTAALNYGKPIPRKLKSDETCDKQSLKQSVNELDKEKKENYSLAANQGKHDKNETRNTLDEKDENKEQ